MTQKRIVLLTLAMVAFAGNSLLCRAALRDTSIDAATFTAIRLISGAAMLWLVARFRSAGSADGSNWLSALALFSYAAGFSFAYVRLPAASGALLLFGAVQTTMIGYGLWHGERLHRLQTAGLAVALGGLVTLLLPGLSAPPLFASLLMLVAGVAWAIYCLRGKSAGNPTAVTAGNFLRAVPFAVLLSLVTARSASIDAAGFVYAVASGAFASGIGYAMWYSVLPSLKRTHAATVQLTVPVIAAFGGILFLGEAMTVRLALASLAVVGGIALVVAERKEPEHPPVQDPSTLSTNEL